ncbi:MAG: hypothetical protein AB7H79_11390 [Sphingomonas sp.]
MPLFALFVLAACTTEEEPVANRFDRTNAEIENKARELEGEVENQVRAVEADMQNQIDAMANQQASRAMPADANMAPTNTAR